MSHDVLSSDLFFF